MTDMFVVDAEGNFVVGKASTTPKDESIGYWNSLIDAFSYWGVDWQQQASEILPQVKVCVYSGTSMLNVLLTREGKKIGLICSRGHEDTLLHERSKQIYAGYGYPDRLHVVTHVHNQPLVPKQLIRGVTERISLFGEVVIPLYESEAKKAVEELIAEGVEGIVIWLPFSYVNPIHEKRVAEIAQEIMNTKGLHIPLYLSGEIAPIMREVSRLNSTLLQAYGAEPARKQLLGIEKKLKEKGYKYPLQIVLASGGVANIRYPRLHEASFSGPIGGIIGGRYLAQLMNISNLICTDMGGTSFDVGLIMGGEPIILREVELGHMIFNIPTLVMDSIGAGTGMYIRVDPARKRLEIGPDSAGAEPGPVCYNLGNEIPTVMDCCLVLGIINPDYYLGGQLKIYPELAYQAIKEKCADLLGLDVYRFAEGVMELIHTRMREHIRSVLYVRGFSPADYYLISYGGAGPMFMAGYTEGLPLKGVFTIPFAAAFSSYGCAAVDYVHRYQKSTSIYLPPRADLETIMEQGEMINAIWEELERLALKEMMEEGFSHNQVELDQIAYIRYGGQLEDLEIPSPVKRIKTADDMNKLLAAFDTMYSQVYAGAAQHEEAGYQMLELGVRATVNKQKPMIKEYPMEGKVPPKEAFKGERKVWMKNKWHVAHLYEMDLLQAGNEIEGLAIIEAPSTTVLVPEGRKVQFDQHKVLWMI